MTENSNKLRFNISRLVLVPLLVGIFYAFGPQVTKELFGLLNVNAAKDLILIAFGVVGSIFSITAWAATFLMGLFPEERSKDKSVLSFLKYERYKQDGHAGAMAAYNSWRASVSASMTVVALIGIVVHVWEAVELNSIPAIASIALSILVSLILACSLHYEQKLKRSFLSVMSGANSIIDKFSNPFKE